MFNVLFFFFNYFNLNGLPVETKKFLEADYLKIVLLACISLLDTRSEWCPQCLYPPSEQALCSRAVPRKCVTFFNSKGSESHRAANIPTTS